MEGGGLDMLPYAHEETSDCSEDFNCGACCMSFQTIGKLHVHLRYHGFGGSYHYNHHTKTAFPKFDPVNIGSQTDVERVPATKPDSAKIEKTYEETASKTKADPDILTVMRENERIFDNVLVSIQSCAAKAMIGKTMDETSVAQPSSMTADVDIKSHPMNVDEGDKRNADKAFTDPANRYEYTLDRPLNNTIKFYNKKFKRHTSVREDQESNELYQLNKEVNENQDVKTEQVKTEDGSDENEKMTHVTCAECKESIAKEDLNDHPCFKMKPKWKCEVCEKSYSSENYYRCHIKTHTGIRDYQCHTCGKLFYMKHLLKMHSELCGVPIEKRRHFQCPICGQFFSAKGSLRQHKKYVHTDIPGSVCDICGQTYKHLRKHMKTHVEDKPKLKCDMCPQTFSQRASLNRHKKLHKSVGSFQCPYCGKSFHENWNLKTHMRQHTDEKPYKCTICGKGFTHNVSRKAHMESHR